MEQDSSECQLLGIMGTQSLQEGSKRRGQSLTFYAGIQIGITVRREGINKGTMAYSMRWKVDGNCPMFFIYLY